jgi:hypothetical protein
MKLVRPLPSVNIREMKTCVKQNTCCITELFETYRNDWYEHILYLNNLEDSLCRTQLFFMRNFYTHV